VIGYTEFRTTVTDDGLTIRKSIDDALIQEFRITDEAIKTAVVYYLRSQGWTVEPPNENGIS
jgi:hypothetical protein